MQSYSTDKQQQIFLKIYAKYAGLKKPGWNTENVIITFVVFAVRNYKHQPLIFYSNDQTCSMYVNCTQLIITN